MDIRYNEATINRPDGDRVLDAPFVVSDIENYIRQLKEEQSWEKNDRNGITIFKTDHFTVVITCLHEHAQIKDNSVKGVLTVQVIEGKMRVTTSSGTMEISKGQLVSFNPEVQHTIDALDETVLLISNSN